MRHGSQRMDFHFRRAFAPVPSDASSMLSSELVLLQKTRALSLFHALVYWRIGMAGTKVSTPHRCTGRGDAPSSSPTATARCHRITCYNKSYTISMFKDDDDQLYQLTKTSWLLVPSEGFSCMSTTGVLAAVATGAGSCAPDCCLQPSISQLAAVPSVMLLLHLLALLVQGLRNVGASNHVCGELVLCREEALVCILLQKVLEQLVSYITIENCRINLARCNKSLCERYWGPIQATSCPTSDLNLSTVASQFSFFSTLQKENCRAAAPLNGRAPAFRLCGRRIYTELLVRQPDPASTKALPSNSTPSFHILRSSCGRT